MYKQVTYQEVEALIQQDNLVIIDVRDRESYEAAHINGAIHLSVKALNDFCQMTDSETPILVYCFHGISSQSVAQYLIEQGFSKVYSLIGGFSTWQFYHPASDTKKS